MARLTSIVFVLLLATSAPAQVAGSHAGLILGYANVGSTTVSALGVVTTNDVLTNYSSMSAAWPAWGNVWGITHDVDNETVLVHGFLEYANPPQTYAVLRWDPRTATVVGTVWSGPFGTGAVRNLTNLALDGDGDLASFDSVLGQLVVFDRMTAQWSGVRIPLVGAQNHGLGGFVWDRIGGGFVYASAPTGQQGLYRTSHDRATTSTIAVATTSVGAGYGGDLLQNGDWLSSSRSGARYLSVAAGTSVWSAGPTGRTSFWDVTAEKFAAPGRGYWATSVSTPQDVVYVDARTTPHTAVTRVSSATQSMPSWILEVAPRHARDLATQRIGTRMWDVHVNPGGGRFAGRSFVVAASLAGARPAAVLPDGRELFLRPDPLTALTAQGPLPPYFTGNVGALDARGRAQGRIDLSRFGPAVDGIVVHLCGVVLDPSAPSGIAWVLDPWALVVGA